MKKSIDIKRVNFPATRHGTQGYSKLFREISRIQFDWNISANEAL